MNRKVLFAGLVLVVPLLLVLASGLRHDPHEVLSPLIGRNAPAFELVDLDGRTIRLADLAGQPVVLNFWATWCPPCVEETPDLVALARRFSGRVRFVGVVYMDSAEAIRRFEGKNGAWGPNLADPEARTAIRYGVYGAPETFLIDAHGVIRDKITGAVNREALARTLDGLL
ncbi:MAG: TlpA disulfide reductase family protein [Thermoanaerobaculia bacterium]